MYLCTKSWVKGYQLGTPRFIANLTLSTLAHIGIALPIRLRAVLTFNKRKNMHLSFSDDTGNFPSNIMVIGVSVGSALLVIVFAIAVVIVVKCCKRWVKF